MPPRFYSSEPISGESIQLTGDEVKHIVGAYRLGVGDDIVLFDGSGDEFAAKIEETHKKRVSVSILQRHSISRELPFELVLAVALPKGDRQKVMVEKLVELGVTRLMPVNAERSVVISNKKSVEKLHRRVIEASKQCGRNRLMEIAAPVAFTELLRNETETKIISHPYQSMPLCDFASDSLTAKKLIVAIGPEGGFTDEEVELAKQAGWQSLALGPTILRVETAAVGAAALFGLGRL